MKLTTAAILELLNNEQQLDLYKKLRAKFGNTIEDEETYYIFSSDYTSRLLKDSKAKVTQLKRRVTETFEEFEIEHLPLFIYDCCWGEGLYLLEGENYVNLGNDMKVISEKIGDELYSVLSQSGDGCICFKNNTSMLYRTMQDLEYCRIFGVESIEHKFSMNGIPIIIERVDS